MKNTLAGAWPVIDNQSKTIVLDFVLRSQMFRYEKKMTDLFSVRVRHMENIGDMFFRNDEGMEWRLRVYVHKSERNIILMNNFCRNYFIDNSAENTILIRTHGSPSEKNR